ncbi:MAG: DsbA family protein [Vicinamibacterales bacterium]
MSELSGQPPGRPESPEGATPPASSPAAARGAAGDRAAGTIFGVVGIALAVVALGALALVYTSLTREIAQLRTSLRLMTAEVAGMRRTPVVDVAGAPAKGSPDAVLTLIEYSDYECPFCIAHFQRTMPELQKKYIDTGFIRYVFRDFPVDENHPEAIRAHIASRCAGEQGRFWNLHDRLFSAPGTHTPEALAAKAAEAGLDTERYAACVASGRYTDDIRRVASQAVNMGANGTPAFFIGLRDPATDQVRIIRAISGAQPLSVFEQTFEVVRQQAQAAADAAAAGGG